MIVTVTLNAALDRTVRVPNFQLGARHRAERSLRLPGGKGVNVARALKTLGQPVIATGLAGGRVGTYIIEELTSEGILNDFVRIHEESRTSTAVMPGSALTIAASSRAIFSVRCFSQLPEAPRAPGSSPPCPASMATITSRSLPLLVAATEPMQRIESSQQVGFGPAVVPAGWRGPLK